MSDLTRDQAEALWSSLRGNLLAAEDDIRQIITTRAWEPLGYDTFADAWADRLSEVRLSSELRAVVVFAMFDQRASDREVALAVSGVGASTVSELRRGYARGMSADDAAEAAFRSRSRARRVRAVPGQATDLKVTLNADEYDEFRRAAGMADASMNEFGRACILRALRGDLS